MAGQQRVPRTVVPRSRKLRGAGDAQPDGFPQKLIKYVPAEVLAFFVPATAALGPTREGLLWVAVAVAVIGTPGYLFLQSRALSPAEQPRLAFYALAVIAFLCWAVGTSTSVAGLVGLDEIEAGFLLAAAVFLVPLIDGVIDEIIDRRS